MKLRVSFIIVSFLAVFSWGSYAQGWRVIQPPSIKSFYLIDDPYFRTVRYLRPQPRSEEMMLHAISLNAYDYHPYTHWRWQLTNEYITQSIYYDDEMKQFVYVEVILTTNSSCSYVYILDQNFQPSGQEIAWTMNLDCDDLVKLKVKLKDRQTGELKTAWVLAFLVVDQSKSQIVFEPAMSSSLRARYEVISDKPIAVHLLKHPSRYAMIPSTAYQIEKGEIIRGFWPLEPKGSARNNFMPSHESPVFTHPEYK